jgi:hypothetical protein
MLSSKVEAITKSKWHFSKKELIDGLLLTCYAPEIEGIGGRNAPLVKSTSDLQVRDLTGRYELRTHC